MIFRQMVLGFSACATLLLMDQGLCARCLESSSHQTTFEVLSCEDVNINDPKIGGLRFYQGVILKVNLLSQERLKSQGQPQYDWLSSEPLPKKMEVFYGTRDKKACSSLAPGTKKKGRMSRACCDGAWDPPCLLGLSVFTYDLKK